MTTGLARVKLKDFDLGVIETIGAELIDITVDGGTRKAYAKTVPGVTTNVPGFGGKVPVFFGYPEDVYQPFKLPCYVVSRTGLEPNFSRAPWYGYRRAPLDNASKMAV